jgi:hypothetical protein
MSTRILNQSLSLPCFRLCILREIHSLTTEVQMHYLQLTVRYCNVRIAVQKNNAIVFKFIVFIF